MLHCNESEGNNLEFHWSGRRRDGLSFKSQKSLETDIDVSSLNLVNNSILRVQDKIFSLGQVLTKNQQLCNLEVGREESLFDTCLFVKFRRGSGLKFPAL